MSTIQKIMTMYWKQITGMMKGGLPVVKCLEAAGKECKDETLAGITEKLIQRLYDGDSLSQAMGEFEAYFPAPVIAMVRDGEVKGRLDEAAANIAQGFEDETFNVNELETYVAELLSDEPGEYGSEDTIKTLNLILLEAFKRKASDIHIEWEEGGMVIRYRIDGVLTKVDSPPEKIQKPLIARIKVMAALDIAERRMPQDGRILIKQEGKEYDLRLSTLPTVTGEAVTIRILSRESISLDLGDLGMPEDNLEKIKEMIAQPHVCVLVLKYIFNYRAPKLKNSKV